MRANWRIIFRFEQGDATDVDLIDYYQKEWYFGGNGDPSRQGVRRRRRDMAAAANDDLAQARQHEDEISVKPVAQRAVCLSG
jgi:hypothetical protein